MPKKVALLIGVSEYGDGIPPLSASPNDVKAMGRILADPNLGGFDEVKPLINPDPITMQIEIKWLFDKREKEDLLLLFFSGHGITDDNNHLYLTTRITAKDNFDATAVPASFVQKQSLSSRAKRQVMILDCCYSGAFADGWQAKSVGVDIKKELGAEGRVVLTSSTATQTSFQQEGSTLSLYTQYLIEGIETGAADRDGDGKIHVQELHNYAKGKVQDVKPNMKPEIILDREGFNILLAQAPKNSEAEYRKIVERYASYGEISSTARLILQKKQQELGIVDDKAAEIESQVLEPFRQRLRNLEIYREAFKEAIEYGYPLAQKALDELKDLQEAYGLRDEDVALIKKEITAEKEAEYQKQQEPTKQQQVDEFETQPQQQQPAPSLPSKSPDETDDLSSEKGVDYTKLRDLLKAGKWQEADQETLTVMLKASGREKEGYLDIASLEKFPCTDLRTIDTLWLKYSDGHFGFSVQKQIWESVGGGQPGSGDYTIYRIYENFGDRVGWRNRKIIIDKKWLGLMKEEREVEEWLQYSELTYGLNAPQGHLPWVKGKSDQEVVGKGDWTSNMGGVSGTVTFELLTWGDRWWMKGYLSSLASRLRNCKI